MSKLYKCNPSPFNPQGLDMRMVCGKCDGDLDLRVVEFEEQDPLGFGTRTRKESELFCNKCDV